MLYYVPAPVLACLLFFGIILSYFSGLRLRRHRASKDPSFESSGLGPLEGALLGLLSLLLAFTFSQSASDFSRQRDLLIAESNAIETALWRADLYPDSLRLEFRKDFRRYIVARIAYYAAGVDEEAIRSSRREAEILASKIWQRAVAVAHQRGEALHSAQMIPAISVLLDAEIKREDARRRHVPDPILWLLFLLCLTGSFLVGYSNKSPSIDWVILCSYALMTVVTIYVILDLDRPRRGIIEVGAAHENIVNLLDVIDRGEK